MATPQEGLPKDEIKGLHKIEDEFGEKRLVEWAESGVEEIEKYLGFFALAEDNLISPNEQ